MGGRLLAGILACSVLVGGDDGGDPPAAPAPVLVPEPGYEPKPGDRVTLYSRDRANTTVWVAADAFAFRDYCRAVRAGDDAGFRELRESRRAIPVAEGEHVLVLAVHDAGFPDEDVAAVEVRFIDGPSKDKKVWCEAAEVANLVERATPKSGARKKGHRR